MKNETETAVRSIVSMDAEVTKDMMERAIVILRGQVESEEDMVHVMKRKDVMKLLSVTRRTIDYYLKQGYLERVYGCGKKNAIGVTRESVLRFLRLRVGRPHPDDRVADRRSFNPCHAGGRHVSQAKGKESK